MTGILVPLDLHLIVAVNNDGVIGHEGKIPWELSEDLNHFAAITRGRAVIMGRKTWDSLPPSKLPGRPCVVLTRSVVLPTPIEGFKNCWFVPNLAVATQHVWLEYGVFNAFVIGGAELYEQTSSIATTMIVTKVNRSGDGDTKLKIDQQRFKKVSEVRWYADVPDSVDLKTFPEKLDFTVEYHCSRGERDHELVWCHWLDTQSELSAVAIITNTKRRLTSHQEWFKGE